MLIPILVLFIIPMLFGLYAQMRIHSTYQKNLQIESRGRITGREAAEAVLHSAGITDVEIVSIEGTLSDHFDPVNKRLALSEANYNGTNLAALGVSAHEAGHAIQQKVGYAMMSIRQTLVPATQIASSVSQFVMIAGFFGGAILGGAFSHTLLLLGAAALAVICIFQFVTLPVEFDASSRAKKQLVNLGIVDRDEMAGVNETLDAAALTYVAAFVASLGSLLYILMLLSGGSGRRDD